MTSKVIYVAIVRLTDKMAADWHINYLLAKGVSVEYWDIVALVREEHSERGALNPPWLHVIRSYDELERRLSLAENRSAYYVMLLSYRGHLTRVFRLLSRHDCRMVRFASGLLPLDPALKWRKIAAWLLSPLQCAREIYGRLKSAGLRKAGLVKPFAVTFAAGAVPMSKSGHSRKMVPINFFDYDSYVRAKAAPATPEMHGRYAVFLDSNLPYHTDLTFCGYTRLDPAIYYRSLNRFFALLEQAHQLRVVIAAHPRADYQAGQFEGRPVRRLSTALLVREAEFVLAHTSSSISFAVLNGKPLVFIYTAAMAANYERTFVREMRCFSDYLQAPIYNIDTVTDGRQVKVGPVHAQCYERYKYNYLTSHQSEERSTDEIVCRELFATR